MPAYCQSDLSLSNNDLAAPVPTAQAQVPVKRVAVRIVPEGNTGVDGNFVYLAEAGEDVELAVEVTSEGQSGGGQLPSIGAQPGHPGRITQDDQTRLVWEWTSGRAYSVDGDRIRWRAGTDGSLAEVRVRYAARSGVTTSSATEVLDSELAEASQGFGELKILPGLSFDRNGDGVIESTVIGIYPNEYDEQAPSVVQRNSMLYHPPDTFYRLDQATRGLQLSAHATLGTLNPPVFDDEKVRFVALDPNLVVLWEELRNQVEEAGKSATGLRILRGFISPHERQRLERMGVKLADFTRYQYGDAFAIIYDLNNDFRMDDLNKDGEITIEDSEVLGDWVEAAMKAMDHKGGIGTSASFEGPNHIGTPYVHADLRGWRERWQER